MTPDLILATVDLAQPGGGGGMTFDSSGIVNWIVKNILPIIIVLCGVGIAFANKKGNYSEVGSRVGILFIGLIVVAGGIVWYAVANDIVGVATNLVLVAGVHRQVRELRLGLRDPDQ